MTVDSKTAALLERLGAHLVPLVLIRREQLSPRLIELEFSGLVEDLVGKPGNDIMVDIATTNPDKAARRRYSIRSVDATARRLRLWIETSSGGPGSTWAATLPTGSAIRVIGPRGQVSLDMQADWHLFIGDLTFLSAAYAMAEAIEPPGQALFIIEVEDQADVVLPALAEDIAVTFVLVDRDGRSPNDPAGLLAAFAALALPELDGHIYLGGELRVVAALRAAVKDRGLSDDQVHAKSYWRFGVANQPHGEPKKDD
jgi:NADPH-dependent ferric siderophore reductase